MTGGYRVVIRQRRAVWLCRWQPCLYKEPSLCLETVYIKEQVSEITEEFLKILYGDRPIESFIVYYDYFSTIYFVCICPCMWVRTGTHLPWCMNEGQRIALGALSFLIVDTISIAIFAEFCIPGQLVCKLQDNPLSLLAITVLALQMCATTPRLLFFLILITGMSFKSCSLWSYCCDSLS